MRFEVLLLALPEYATSRFHLSFFWHFLNSHLSIPIWRVNIPTDVFQVATIRLHAQQLIVFGFRVDFFLPYFHSPECFVSEKLQVLSLSRAGGTGTLHLQHLIFPGFNPGA